MSDYPVEHDEANHRWVIRHPDGLAELRYTRVQPSLLDLHHTEVPVALRGRGLAGQLVRAALDEIRARGDMIIPTCPYVAKWIEAHPEDLDLVGKAE